MGAARRLRAVERFRPGAATRILGALRREFPGVLDDDAALSRHSAGPALSIAERGGPVSRAAAARLRKRLIRVLCPERLDHRSGRFQRVRAAVAREVDLELRVGARGR